MKRRSGRRERRSWSRCVSAEALESRWLLTTLYVDAHATSATHNGVTWNTAYLDLQQALSGANSGDTVRVADGTYHPGSGTVTTVTFQLKNGATVQGGYAGFGAPDPNARDIAANKTILSGFLSASGSTSYFAHSVVTGSGTNSTAVLDGFTITLGYAPTAGGGGMYNSAGSPTVSNCTFYYNEGQDGGGMYNISGSAPTITNCAFLENFTFGTNGGGGMYNSGSSPTIQNSRFQENFSVNGGGIYNTSSSSPNITNTLISHNTANTAGGGIYSGSTCSPVLTGCTISWNRSNPSLNAGGGGGAYCSSSAARFVACKFIHNACREQDGGRGAGLYITGSTAPTVVNCLFDGNASYYGGGVYSNLSAPSFTNCTFAQNTAASTGSGPAITQNSSASAILTLTNCVVWGNTGISAQISASAGSISVSYSDVQGGFAGTANINVDPIFVNAVGTDGVAGNEDDDLRLRPSSPANDAANNGASALSGITTDLSGAARFLDIPTSPDTGAGAAPIIDMGAYETQPISLQADAFGPYLVAVGQSLQLKSYGYSDQAGSLTFDWDFDGDGQYDDATGASPTFSAADFTGAAVVTVGVRITDGANRTVTDTATVNVIPPVIYVDDSAPGANNGGSWTDAYQSLATAMLDALAGCEIRVAQGTYKPTTSTDWTIAMELKTGVSLIGGYAGYGAPNPDLRNPTANPTILSGDIGTIGDKTDNSNHILTVHNSTVSMVIDGFTIRDGNNWGTIDNGAGGGIDVFVGSITIRNCIFLRNSCNGGGGGLVINGGGSVSNCIFEGNLGDHGGAINVGEVNNPGELDFINCLIVGNMGYQGAGIWSFASSRQVKFINCNISYNRAANADGVAGDGQGPALYMISGTSSHSLNNCIVWGNTIGQQSTFTFTPCYPSTPTNNNSNIQGFDPLFVKAASAGADTLWGSADDDYGDLHLKTGSPAIDTGSNSNVPASVTLDLDGKARFVDVPSQGSSGMVVDQGPFEFSTTLSVSNSFLLTTTAPTLRFVFNHNMTASTITRDDLSITNTDTSQPIDVNARTTLAYTSSTAQADWSFVYPMPDGNYHAMLAAGSVSDAGGTGLPADSTIDFFILAADADHNRTVNTADFTMLAGNFNKTSVGFAKGDFNYDGKVNALDFNILATMFGTTLPAPPLAPIATAPIASSIARGIADLFSGSSIAFDKDHENLALD